MPVDNCIYTAVTMAVLVLFGLVLFDLISPINSNQEVSCDIYIPGSDPSSQPMTYCGPIDCSRAIHGTTWHVLEGYTNLGRCCKPVYGWNGTFEICESNGKPDRLTACDDGLYNWNSPFSSEEYTIVSGHAYWVCSAQGPLSDSDIPRVMWKQPEFIVREGLSVTLLAKVQSSTKPVKIALLREKEQFPMSDLKLSSHFLRDNHLSNTYQVYFTLSNVTATYADRYYFVVTNVQASGWSGPTQLVVLKGTEQSPSSSIRVRSCMSLIIFMACVILLHWRNCIRPSSAWHV